MVYESWARRTALGRWLAAVTLLAASFALLAPVAARADTLIKMNAARLYPQVTLLQDSTVLVAGGIGTSAALASAERFDPKTGVFTALPNMSSARDDSEQALLLPDGRVLITGGNATKTADLFDPATNTFSRAGLMTQVRGGDTQTLLPDGRVLLAGGWSAGGRWGTAEIFDPKTNQFAATNSMSWGRYRHTAARLPDGRSVVLGGLDGGIFGNVPLASVEAYDPKTGVFSLMGEMTVPRFNHQSVLLADGRILVVGGYRFDDAGNGMWEPNSSEIFDPATGQGTTVDALANLPQDPVVVRLADGRVLIAGGSLPGAPPSAANFPLAAMLFDPVTGKTTPAAPLAQGRTAANAALLTDGRVLIVGGGAWNSAKNQTTPTDTAEIYTP